MNVDKPCPFCGSDALEVTARYVHCDNCNVSYYDENYFDENSDEEDEATKEQELYNKYCDEYNIPVELREELRNAEMTTYTWELFLLSQSIEELRIKIENTIPPWVKRMPEKQ